MMEDTVMVPGFGFLDRQVWTIVEPLRRVSGGNLTDEEVCGRLASIWMDQRAATEEGLRELQDTCWPQWDGVAACVPSSRVGQKAVLPCMSFYRNEKGNLDTFDTSYNITKLCEPSRDPGGLGGTWANWTNYNQCLANVLPRSEEWPENVFLVGYTVSLLSLMLAIFIFIYFRELRCLRHRIHTQLFCSLLATSTTWIVSCVVLKLFILSPGSSSPELGAALSTFNCILHILLRYFNLSIFFWTFVEGLYLFLQVQASFSVGNLKLRHCVAIGWGTPLLMALLWTLVVYCTAVASRRLEDGYDPLTSSLNCPFIVNTGLSEMLLYTLPICSLLICNTVFLIWIMGVVVSKLQAPSIGGNNNSANLRATKALFIIVPLLGITYLITLRNPFPVATLESTLFQFITNVLISFQGFFVSLPYCFLNSEVSQMVRTHWERWRTNRDIGTAPQSARNSIATQAFTGVCENLNRTRSHTYQTVRNSLVTLDRRGTEESLGKSRGPARARGEGAGRPDGPLVPQPDLIPRELLEEDRL